MEFYPDIEGNPQAVDLFKTTFQAPLPMSGSASSKLSDLPVGMDYVTALGSNREIAMTSWNTQSHYYQTSFGYTIAARPVHQEVHPAPRVTILFDGALNQVVAKMNSLNMTMRRELLSGRERYITSLGAHLTKLPRQYNARSSAYSDAVATSIAQAFDEGRLTNEPPNDAPGDSDIGEIRPVTGSLDGISGGVSTRNVAVGNSMRPAKSKAGAALPVRSVRTVAMAFKGFKAAKPPKSPSMIAIEAYATGNDRAATQPYISTTRGVLARDVSSVQEMVAYAAAYNVSHVDTAPALRGLLYAYPRSRDVWSFDSFDARFVRRQRRETREQDRLIIHQTPNENRVTVRIAAVTLPAFSSHLKNLDPGMSAVGANGVSLSGMDTDWTAVPLSSDMTGCPWLLEYILIHTTTEIWSGKLNILSHASNATDQDEARVYTTGMPAAHQVHIPGPRKILLVMLDENTYAQAAGLTLPGIGAIPIYRGTRIATGEADFATFWRDIHPHLYTLLTDANYLISCQNMVQCLQFVENNLCTSMAFQLAVTLAAELSSIVPESPSLHAGEQGGYVDELAGGWSIGPYNMNTRRPRHQCSNINEGDEQAITTRIRRLLHGYAFASTSPMQQHAVSYVLLDEQDILANDAYVGTATYWHTNTPERVVPQYQCNTANSVYRLLSGLGMIVKDDYTYCFRTPDGLANVVTMQGVALTLSLGIALTKSDVSRKAWSGLGVNDAPVSQTPIREWVSDMTQGMVIPTHTDAHMATTINGNFSIDQEIQAYYGTSTTHGQWGHSVCMPYPIFLQWGKKFNINMIGEYVATEGVITANLESPHLLVGHKDNCSISWLSTTLDTHMYLPEVYLDYARAVPFQLHMSAEDWQRHTAADTCTYFVPAGLTSNLICTSLKHHYKLVTQPGSALIINKNAMRSKVVLWSTSELQYPDPPNSGFLARQGLQNSSDLEGRQDGVAILPQRPIQETESRDDSMKIIADA